MLYMVRYAKMERNFLGTAEELREFLELEQERLECGTFHVAAWDEDKMEFGESREVIPEITNVTRREIIIKAKEKEMEET